MSAYEPEVITVEYIGGEGEGGVSSSSTAGAMKRGRPRDPITANLSDRLERRRLRERNSREMETDEEKELRRKKRRDREHELASLARTRLEEGGEGKEADMSKGQKRRDADAKRRAIRALCSSITLTVPVGGSVSSFTASASAKENGGPPKPLLLPAVPHAAELDFSI
jgi:hypothetical protein